MDRPSEGTVDADREAKLEAKRIEAARKRKATLARPREQLLYTIGYRCLAGGEPLSAVAEDLGVTRSFATTLLSEVSDERHAFIEPQRVHFRSPENLPALITDILTQRYKLRHVRIVPTPPDDRALDTAAYRAMVRKNLGWAAADLVSDYARAKPNAVIGVNGGRTTMAFASAWRPPAGTRTVLRPLLLEGDCRYLGHVGAGGVLRYAFAQHEYLSITESHSRIVVQSPDAPPSLILEVKESGSWIRYPEIAALFGPDARPPDVVLTTIGRRRLFEAPPGTPPHRYASSLVERMTESAHYLEWRSRPQSLFRPIQARKYRLWNRLLFNAGAVGDICYHPVAADGQPAHPPRELKAAEWPLERTTLAPSLEELKRWAARRGGLSIAMGGTSAVAPVMRAALTGGYFNAVVLDLALGLQLLTKRERHGIYGLIEDVPLPPQVERLPAKQKLAKPRRARRVISGQPQSLKPTSAASRARRRDVER